MIPIALLAAPAARSLPALLERVWTTFSAVFFGFLASAIWAGWAIMMASGVVPDWRLLRRVLPVEFIPHFETGPAVVAALLTCAAFVGARILWNRPARGLTVWVLGLTLTWSLLTTLWMPWLDFAKSYRSVFSSMPLLDTNCVASLNLGEGERAMLRYITGHNPMRLEVAPNSGCKALLVQREAAFGEPSIDPVLWQEVWRGSCPGVTNERFWLFQLKEDTEMFYAAEDEWAASLGVDTCRQSSMEESEICEN